MVGNGHPQQGASSTELLSCLTLCSLHCIFANHNHAHELDPRLTCNFTSEDQMGILKALRQHCVGDMPNTFSLPMTCAEFCCAVLRVLAFLDSTVERRGWC